MDYQYLATGEAVVVVQKLECGYLVEHVVEYCDEPFRDGRPVVVDQVFATPPVSVFDQQIAMRNEEIAQLNSKLHELRVQIKEEEQRIEARRKAFAEHAALAKLEDFIAGRITHFVFADDYGSFRIEDFETAMKPKDERRDWLRLLCLFGKSNGKLNWGINQYYDGSGSFRSAIPCTSHDEAKQVAQAIIDAGYGNSTYRRDKMIEAAREHGLRVPSEWIEARSVALRKAREEQVREAETKLEAARAALAEAGAE